MTGLVDEHIIMMRPVHFLIYINRSGSTFLAQRLSQFEDVAVGFECRLGKKFFINFCAEDSEQLTSLVDDAYLDQKFSSWNVCREELLFYLERQQKPIRIDKFLSMSLNLHFRNDPAKILIHKGKEIFSKLEYFLEMFQKSKVVYIQRDPIAILNSQRKAIDSYTKMAMANEIIDFAYDYKIKTIMANYYSRKFKKSGRFVCIKYENLITNEEEEMGNIINFLNVRNIIRKNGADYKNGIPIEQKHLHKNVGKSGIEDRIWAWKHEVPDEDQVFLKFVLKNEIYLNCDNDKIKVDLSCINKLRLFKRVFLFYYRYGVRILSKRIVYGLKLKRIKYM